VDVSLLPLERIRQIINISYINRYCTTEGLVEPVPPFRERVHQGTVLNREHFDASM